MKECGEDSVEEPAANDAPGDKLAALLAAAGQPPLSSQQRRQFSAYLALIVRWNARTNLTAIRTEEGILSRHFVESIVCARAIPQGVSTLLDFGSGAGLPGIPIAICRAEIAVTLAESQGKKAAFLQEAVRTLQLSATVYHGRAEALQSQYDCVTLRAVDKMAEAVAAAAGLVKMNGVLAVMTTEREFPVMQEAAGRQYTWGEVRVILGGSSSIVALGVRGVAVA